MTGPVASAHRLLVASQALEEDAPDIGAAARRHLKVLRPKNGEQVELFDGHGRWRAFAYEAREGRLVASGGLCSAPPPEAGLSLFACVTKGSRWDWTVEKATELGVSRIVPVISGRTIVRIPREERAAKQERWMRIAEDAARQSDAKWLPEICEAKDFAEAAECARGCAMFVGALVEPPPRDILSAVEGVLSSAGGLPPGGLGVFIGPEGDFTPSEMESLLGFATPVSLGPSVLRAETAAIYAVSVLAAALRAVNRY